MADNDIPAPQPKPESQNTPEPAIEEEFKDRANFFIKEFDEKLQQEEIKIAFAVVIDPEHKQPIVYTRGNTYQLARLLVEFANYFKERLNQELKV